MVDHHPPNNTMKYTCLLFSALTICLLPSCDSKQDEPPARETSKEELKDALDTRDNELVKDVAEEIKGEEEVVKETPPAREDTKEDIKDELNTRDAELVKDVAEELEEAADTVGDAVEETVDDVTGEE